jgi:hypothetical protein
MGEVLSEDKFSRAEAAIEPKTPTSGQLSVLSRIRSKAKRVGWLRSLFGGIY